MIFFFDVQLPPLLSMDDDTLAEALEGQTGPDSQPSEVNNSLLSADELLNPVYHQNHRNLWNVF